jgi:hypothetical protein
VAPGFQTISDNTGRLSIQVPVSWTDVDTLPEDADGVQIASLSAAPDLQVFRDTFDGPGLYFHEAPAFVADPAAEVARIDLASSGCSDGGRQPVSNPSFTGAYQAALNCAGTQTDLYFVIANPVDGQQTSVVLVVQVTDADTAALQTALATFSLNVTV